jgi:hypothetical protein
MVLMKPMFLYSSLEIMNLLFDLNLIMLIRTMKGINTLGQALDSGDVASFSTLRDGVSLLAFPALAPERNHHADSFPLAPLGNEETPAVQPTFGSKKFNVS